MERASTTARGSTQGRFQAGVPVALRESTLARLRLAATLMALALVATEALTLFEVWRARQPFYWGVHLARLLALALCLWGRHGLADLAVTPATRLGQARLGVWLLALLVAFQECYYWPSSGQPWGLSRVGLLASLAPVLIPDRLLPSLAYCLGLLATMPLAQAASPLVGLPPISPWDSFMTLARHLVSVGVAWIAAATVNQLRDALATEYGSYKLLRKLGQGGFGEVWEATHRHHRRPAAIKIIRADCDDETAARFLREADTLSRLDCPHTVRLYDYGSSETGQLYLVMELLKGIDLDQLARRFGPQPPERVTSILTQACLSLEEAHERGLIHRDIKPANLFLCQVGVEPDFVKVLDFGLVKASSQDHLTRTDAVLGTPDYMSPEQIQGQPLGAASDLYSLGAVGYYLLTGSAVFSSPGNPMEVLLGHLTQTPQDPGARLGQPLPAALVTIVMRCLAKAPEDRYPSARALYQDLVTLPHWGRAEAAAWWAQREVVRQPK